jgi:hypothetical protein|tara:strand:- start:53 stop:697 length:645 start_codon:yes stop_codon:yes gene_type:complete
MKITVPTSLNEITLGQYKHFLRIEEKADGDRFLQAKMIEIFCGVPLDKVILLKLKDSEEMIQILSDLFQHKPELVKSFKIGNTKYGFHPQLDDLTLGEYIDLDTFIGDWDNMERAMNVLYRPVLTELKDKYTIDKYVVENDVLLLNMPMDAVMSAIFFLWNLGLDLSRIITNSLDNQGSEALIQYLNSQQSGDGINQFTDSLKEMLQELKISLN